ncbi:MAG: hypothetical protein KKD73_11130 [Proteobacteria bacterium]|nr:hypothetical protein [Pseudomonadota bacterium]MBU1641233.1 hypothetical protein [Pseudomonadota bacterium]
MSQKNSKLSMWDRFMMAITFAEAGEPDTAVEMLNRKTSDNQKDSRLRKTTQRPELRV